MSIAGLNKIRAYNRISIYIGFISILWLLLVIQKTREKIKSHAGVTLINLLTFLIPLFAIFDQTSDYQNELIKINSITITEIKIISQIWKRL